METLLKQGNVKVAGVSAYSVVYKKPDWFQECFYVFLCGFSVCHLIWEGEGGGLFVFFFFPCSLVECITTYYNFSSQCSEKVQAVSRSGCFFLFVPRQQKTTQSL